MAGNSRVFLGLSPRHMGKVYGSYRILNFGFVACSLDRRYLEHAASLLDANSSRPILILGICPHALMKPSSANGYVYWSSQSLPERNTLLRQIWYDNFSGKAFIKTNARNLLNLSRGRPLNRYFADGWEACLPVRKQQDEYIKASIRVAQHKRVRRRMVDEFLQVVSEFHQNGITVIAYRPPSHVRMRQEEEGPSGLDFQDLAKRFTQAGGTWLEVNPEAYQTYDGAHLAYPAAIRLSRDLARYL
ncbi:MAG: hypothetical protein KQI62_02475 [Deltaproteobacteria bacterium]|nr:hypothetical protein [Deltaproteobacteria bacterium]